MSFKLDNAINPQSFYIKPPEDFWKKTPEEITSTLASLVKTGQRLNDNTESLEDAQVATGAEILKTLEKLPKEEQTQITEQWQEVDLTTLARVDEVIKPFLECAKEKIKPDDVFIKLPPMDKMYPFVIKQRVAEALKQAWGTGDHNRQGGPLSAVEAIQGKDIILLNQQGVPLSGFYKVLPQKSKPQN